MSVEVLVPIKFTDAEWLEIRWMAEELGYASPLELVADMCRMVVEAETRSRLSRAIESLLGVAPPAGKGLPS